MTAAFHLLDAHVQARRNFRQLRGQRLADHQDRRARSIIEHAMSGSEFYRSHLSGSDISRWRELPTTDKALIMANFSGANTCGISGDEAMDVALTAERTRDFTPTVRGVTVGLSSGTSGHRMLFLASRNEQARWVGTVLARLLPPFRVRGHTITLFSLSGSNLYDDMRGRWLRFHHHDVAMRIPDAVRALNAEQPDLLCAPPLYLRALAEHQLAGELRVSPRRVISVADVLEPEVETVVSAAFGCRVAQVYQCSEGLVAISCPKGRLHVQEDLTAVQFEPLDGSRHTPIITDLWHRTLPIIRYRLGDVVTLSDGECDCGSAFQGLASVEGRNDDVCEFIDAEGASRPVFPAMIRRMVMLAGDMIVDFDATQQRVSHLRVRVEPVAGAKASTVIEHVHASILAGLAAHGIPSADVETVAEAPSWKGLKRRRIRRARAGGEDAS